MTVSLCQSGLRWPKFRIDSHFNFVRLVEGWCSYGVLFRSQVGFFGTSLWPQRPSGIWFCFVGEVLLFLQTSFCSDFSVLVWSTLPVCHSAGNGGDSTTGFVQVPAHRWDKLQVAISGPAPAHRNRVPVRMLASCVD